jgi:formate dehydrogenase subunit delta
VKDEDLIRMANQIAAFFTPYTEEEALKGIAGHIAMFWEPRMRTQLLEIAPAAKGLDPLVKRALEDPSLSPA